MLIGFFYVLPAVLSLLLIIGDQAILSETYGDGPMNRMEYVYIVFAALCPVLNIITLFVLYNAVFHPLWQHIKDQ